MKHKKIMFVCSGNTCRSPMAEYILRNKLRQLKIKWWDSSSCGLFADVGGAISPNSKTALAEINIAVKNFKPRQLTQALIDKSFAVICMTEKQKQIIDGCGKVYCVKELCGFDIPDPYGFDIEAYRKTREAIALACDKIIEKIILNENKQINV